MSEIALLRDIVDLILSYGENNDGTNIPFWGVVMNSPHGKVLVSSGIWFNRHDAEQHLTNTRYNYKPSAHVYCFSGHSSWHMRRIYELAKFLKESKP